MKKIISVFIAFLVITISHAKDIELFIFAGQSNAQGWKGNAARYPKDTKGVDKTIPFYWVTPKHSTSKGKWTTLCAQGGRFKAGHFGPEVTFARALKKDGRNVAFFKYSLGATGLSKDWKLSGEKGMYDDMVKELKKAVKLLEKSGDRVKFSGFVWIQGESDGVSKAVALAYKEKLKSMIEDLRKNVTKNPKLRVILGVDEQHHFIRKKSPVLLAQHELAKEDKNIVFTSMIGLKKADATHLTPEGLEEHGERLYEGYKKLLKGNR